MNLKSRLEKLESVRSHDELTVLIFRWAGAGDFARVCAPGGQSIDRYSGEDKDAFVDRAASELQVLTKQETRVGPLVLWVLRESELPALTVPQLHPQLTREEWLIAHGLNPV